MINKENLDKKIIITVDPGKQGAIILCKYENGKFDFLETYSFDFCGDYFSVASLISKVCLIALKTALESKLNIVVALERPFPTPINSRKSISAQFALYGSTLLALQQPFAQKISEICPRSWVTETCTKNERELKKEGRFLACERIFGSEIKKYYTIKNKNKIKLHDGIADAMLMCAYIAKKNTSKII